MINANTPHQVKDKLKILNKELNKWLEKNKK
jgi:hypothetical protein